MLKSKEVENLLGGRRNQDAGNAILAFLERGFKERPDLAGTASRGTIKRFQYRLVGAAMNKFMVYTGPTLVKTAADRLRAAGMHVTLEGTCNVYVNANSAAQVLAALPSWTWRDVHPLN